MANRCTKMKFLFSMYVHAIVHVQFLWIEIAPCDGMVHNLPAIDTLCRHQQVCSEGTNSTTAGKKGCCTECSCQDDCNLHGNCCFDSMNEQSSISRRFKTCMSTQLRESPTIYPFAEAFYVVTNVPEDGCPAFLDGNMSAAEHATCCDTNVVIWGSFMPVTSAVTGTTYKNQNFANCYGDQNTLSWLAYQMCDGFSSIQGPHTCNILFIFPGNPSVIEHDRCFTNTYGKCPDNFTVVPGLGVTITETRKMCDSDFISPIRGWHPVKNAYCLICIVGMDPSRMPISYCIQDQNKKTSLSGFYDFTSLFDQSVMKQLSTKQEPGSECEVYDGYNISSCRGVLCPLGQIRKENSGACLWMSEQWTVKTIRVFLKAELTTPVDGFTNKELLNSITSGNMTTPWKDQWNMIQIFTEEGRNCSVVDYIDHIRSGDYSVVNIKATHFFIEIGYNQEHLNPADFFSKMDKNLLDDIEIDWRGDVIRLKQSVSPFGGWASVTNVFGIFFMRPHQAQYKNLTYVFQSASYYRLTFINADRIRALVTHFFSKLLTCRQIELREGEFESAFHIANNNSKRTAIVTKAGKVLYTSDFRLFQAASGVTAVRICLEDSGFIQIETSSASIYSHLFKLNRLTLILLFVKYAFN